MAFLDARFGFNVKYDELGYISCPLMNGDPILQRYLYPFNPKPALSLKATS